MRDIKEEDILFKQHFYEKKEKDRQYLSEELIINSLKNIDNLEGFQRQRINDEERYRIEIKLSNKYNLVVIFEIKDKNLYIITAWKTNRKWQKTMQK